MENLFNTLIDGLVEIIPDIFAALLIFVISLYLAKVLSNLVLRTLKIRKVPESARQLLAGLTRASVIVVGTILALQMFFDVATFLSGLGILALTVGFALQDVMKNFAAGVILVIQQPFKVDEFVGVAGFDGTIVKLDLRSTEIKAVDGRVVILPNADILAKPIINYTRATRRRIEVPIGVAYETDPEIARKVVTEALRNVQGAVTEPAPQIGFSNFGLKALELTAYFWIDTALTNPIAAKDAALSLTKDALQKQGIEIPFAIRDVYMRPKD